MNKPLEENREDLFISELAILVLDLEFFYNLNIISGLNKVDLSILNRIKLSIKKLVKNNNIDNINLVATPKDRNAFAYTTAPRVNVSYNEIIASSTDISGKTFEKENLRSNRLIRAANLLINSKKPVTIDEVKKKYLDQKDSYLITIEPKTEMEFFYILEVLASESRALSLSELYLSQQLTKKYKMEYTKPDEILTSQRNKNTLYIEIKNTNSENPEYYLLQLIRQIEFKYKSLQHSREDIIFRSIHNSLVVFNLNFG